MPRTLLAACGLIALSIAAAAEETPPDGQWRGSGGAALTATGGNTATSAVALNAAMRRATEADKWTLGAAATRAESRSDGVTADKWSAAGQYDRNLSSSVYAFGKLGLEGDRVVDLDWRGTLGAGLGWKLVNTPELEFSVFAGAARTEDRYGSVQTIDGVSASRFARNSLLLGETSSHRLAENTRLRQRLELYPGVDGDRAVLAKFTGGLETAVSRTLSVNVNLVADHNSEPPAGRRNLDWSLLAGLSVRFGAP